MRCVVLGRLREELEPGDATEDQRYRGDDVEPIVFEIVHLAAAEGQVFPIWADYTVTSDEGRLNRTPAGSLGL